MLVTGVDMDHIGKRIEHLMELHELWSEGLRIASIGHITEDDKVRIVELGSAIRLLEFYMQANYDDYPEYGRTINLLPKNPEDIPNE
jgi:hypothetical protein